MDPPEHRFWMYNRLDEHSRTLNDYFVIGVDEFINFACQQPIYYSDGVIRCPCVRCKSRNYQVPEDVRYHLLKKGFKPNYWYWTENGEDDPNTYVDHVLAAPSNLVDKNVEDRFREMVHDAMGPQVGEQYSCQSSETEVPNADAKRFFDLLDAVSKPIYEGCNHSQLSYAVRHMSIKADYNVSLQCVDEYLALSRESHPYPELLPKDYYDTKKLVSKLGLKSKRIDCCPNGCMLYYKDDADAELCKFCGHDRYKPNDREGKKLAYKWMHYLPLIPRLQRLYASMSSAPHMRWHYENRRSEDVMCHPSDGQSWKFFDQVYPDFASDPRNVRLGLCSDGFNPFNQSGSTYSCWPVIVTPYNLPPEMCMTAPYMFLTCLIPGPNNPKSKIDIFIQPLIDELLDLWYTGALTYDVATKENFLLRAALMWTINDFPAYGMLSGWQTAGRLACPICMDNTKAFRLKHGGKTSWFDCHRQFLPADHPFRRNQNAFKARTVDFDPSPERVDGPTIYSMVENLYKITDTGEQQKFDGYGVSHNWTKRSIFWDLPYWQTNMIRHNLDVMHIEKNVFDNIFNTIMDVSGKTKDNEKARRDIQEICKRRDLHLQISRDGEKVYKPKGVYTLTLDQRRSICAWLEKLRLPDGYASNLSRCVDSTHGRLSGLKSHDCHILLQNLLPVALKSLPRNVWEPLAELSAFFRSLCSTSLRVDDVFQLQENIPAIICKLERIFPPALFDVMEHLPVHLPYETWAGGPVQYRWMYPFERYMGKLKRSVKQKSRVEGSICEAYLCRETSHFVSYYFEPNIPSARSRVGRHDDGGATNQPPTLQIFNQPCRPTGRCTTRYLTDDEYRSAHLHVLINCPEIGHLTEYFQETNNILGQMDHMLMTTQFARWFREYVGNPRNNITSPFLRDLCLGPQHRVRTWNRLFVNGFNFHTKSWSEDKKTDNSGICVKGIDGTGSEDDWFGTVTDIIELEYPGGGAPEASYTV